MDEEAIDFFRLIIIIYTDLILDRKNDTVLSNSTPGIHETSLNLKVVSGWDCPKS